MISRKAVRTKVLHTLYSHYSSEDKSFKESEDELNKNMQQSYNLYNLTLWLGVEMLTLAENKIKRGKNKIMPFESDLNPSMNFADNRVVNALKDSYVLGVNMEKENLTWLHQQEMLKRLFKTFTDTEEYIAYIALEEATMQDDISIMELFYKQIVVMSEEFEEELEDISIFWNDDFDVALAMVLKTLKRYKTTGDMDLAIVPMFMNDDIQTFALNLLRKSLVLHDDTVETLSNYTENWDVERVAVVDMIILEMGVCEFITFPSIPVKVTLNEYIELAKNYSTKNSGSFINGMLDRISKDFLDKNKINKTGRGLL